MLSSFLNLINRKFVQFYKHTLSNFDHTEFIRLEFSELPLKIYKALFIRNVVFMPSSLLAI